MSPVWNKKKNTQTPRKEIKFVVTRDGREELKKSQMGQTSSSKINKY